MDDITRRPESERMLRARIDAFDGETQSAWSLWYDLRHLALVRVYANDTSEATQLLILAGKVKDTEDLRAPARKCSLDRTANTTTWARYAAELELASDRLRAGAAEDSGRIFVDIARARAWEEPPADVLAYLLSLVRFLNRKSATYGDAEVAARAAVAFAEARHTSPHPEVLAAVYELNTCLIYQRRRSEVTALEERRVALHEAIYGQTLLLAEALFSLAYRYGDDGGQWERALDATRRGFALIERLAGPDSLRAAWRRATLAAALSRCGRIDEAIVEAERAYRRLARDDSSGEGKMARNVARQLEELRAANARGATP